MTDTIPCRLCGGETRMLGTRLCDRCWELERRIRWDTLLAERVLREIRAEQTEEAARS